MKKTIIRFPAVKSFSAALLGVILACAALPVQAQTRTLSFATPNPPEGTRAQEVWEWWADQIYQQTNHSLKIKFYYMSSLVKLRDAKKAVSSGVADIAFMSPAYTANEMPLWYLENTHIGTGDAYIVTEAFRRTRENFQPLKDEEKRNNFKYIAHMSNGPMVFISKTRPYVTPADFKGDKVRMPGTIAKVSQLADWNVTPVSLYFGDIYSALGRGTISGAITYLNKIAPNSQNEVAKYAVEPNLGQNSNVVMMNLDTWNSLSDEQQAVIDGLYRTLLLKMARAHLDEEDIQRKQLQENAEHPMTFVEMNEQQRALWAKGLALSDQEMVRKLSRWSPHVKALYQAYGKQIIAVQKEVEAQGYPWEQDKGD